MATEAMKAREIIVNALKSKGWNVRKASGAGNFIYTTPSGRESTLCLLQFENRGFWRWHIDRNSVRVWGRLRLVGPNPPEGKGNDNQLTVCVDELTVLAEWLAHWMIAADAGKELPICPVTLCNGHTWAGGYDWTVRADSEYKLR